MVRCDILLCSLKVIISHCRKTATVKFPNHKNVKKNHIKSELICKPLSMLIGLLISDFCLCPGHTYDIYSMFIYFVNGDYNGHYKIKVQISRYYTSSYILRPT